MCILNEIQFLAYKAILHIFQENQEELPYIYASEWCNKCVCEHVLHDAHDKIFTTIKAREAYVLFAKTGQSGLTNRNIQFFQTDYIEKKTYITQSMHLTNTHIGKNSI
jgi:hypothetical protein